MNGGRGDLVRVPRPRWSRFPRLVVGFHRKLGPGLLLLLVLISCGGELSTPGEALRVFGESLPQAYLGETYSAPVRVVGGLRPYSYRLIDGSLPEGVDLQAGQLRGTPLEEGVFDFTVAVSDANLSETFQEYTLSVIRRPPPRLALVSPLTEVRQPVTIRLTVSGASGLRGVSALISWDPSRFELLPGSIEPAEESSALLTRIEQEGVFQADLAALGSAWEGDRTLLTFTLAPAEPAVPALRLAANLVDDRGNDYFQPEAGGQPDNATTDAPPAGTVAPGDDDGDAGEPDEEAPDEAPAADADDPTESGDDDLPAEDPDEVDDSNGVEDPDEVEDSR